MSITNDLMGKQLSISVWKFTTFTVIFYLIRLITLTVQLLAETESHVRFGIIRAMREVQA